MVRARVDHGFRRPTPSERRPRARAGPPSPAAAVLELQRGAGNHAVARAVAEQPGRLLQRSLRKTDGTALNPKQSHVAWAKLTPEQRTLGLRLVNDKYKVYEFTDMQALYAVLTGAHPVPDPVESYWKKSGDPTAAGTGTGAQDPLLGYHTAEATGGLNVTEVTKPQRAPRHKFGETSPHKSNWASFVELHYHGAWKKLQDAGKYTGTAKATLDKLRARAIANADVMDKQEVREDEQLSMSSRGGVMSGVHVEDRVNEMWDLVATELKKPRATFARAALPRWGQLKQGMGTRVDATFVSGANQSVVAGSAADTDLFYPPWLVQIGRRLNVHARSLYVEGHLLNDNLGGPAAPYNIVPLTDNANKVHLGLVESYVKAKVLQMLDEEALGSHGMSPSLNPITTITYSVEAKYDAFPRRTNTQRWINAYNLLLAITELLPTIKPPKGLKAFDAKMSVKEFRDHLFGGSFMPHAAKGTTLNYKDTWGVLQDAMNVVAFDRASTTLEAALKQMDAVSDVWLDEEKYVPTKLVCNAKTVRADGDEDEDGSLKDKEVENQIGLISFPEWTRD
jgi:hypothetical protein